MRIIDNISASLGDDLNGVAKKGKVRIAACVFRYTPMTLKDQLSDIESLEFIFTSPTFVASEATDKIHQTGCCIPKLERENSIYGSIEITFATS